MSTDLIPFHHRYCPCIAHYTWSYPNLQEALVSSVTCLFTLVENLKLIDPFAIATGLSTNHSIGNLEFGKVIRLTYLFSGAPPRATIRYSGLRQTVSTALIALAHFNHQLLSATILIAVQLVQIIKSPFPLVYCSLSSSLSSPLQHVIHHRFFDGEL